MGGPPGEATEDSDGQAETVILGESGDAAAESVIGAQLGRYVLLGGLGTGAMGTVVRAYDPKLCREVALKLLRSQRGDDASAARLLREAQAMAQLAHTNVVAVHDVEQVGESVAIVMELVGGSTLQQWLATTRPWPDVLAAFVQAGKGLAAAHRVGLVHRDFKPSNVLVTDDGVIKVTDFGLAKLAAALDVPQTPSPARVVDGWHPDRSTLSAAITRDDVVIGTPRYMAPEQLEGRSADARADQYAFCVALWDALCGEPLFSGTPEQMLARKRGGPGPWPAGVAVPGVVIAAIRRGLAPVAEHRWPDLDGLLAALQQDAAGRRRRRWLGVGAIACAAAVAFASSWLTDRAQRCSGGTAIVEQVWNDEHRARVDAAVRAIGKAYVDDLAPRIDARLDEYAAAWREHHRDACEATARGEQSPHVMDLRMACVQRALATLRSVVELLAGADARAVEHAPELLDRLPALDRCDDLDALAQQLPPPDDPTVAAAVASARERLEVSDVALAATHYDEASAALDAVEHDAHGLGYVPLDAEIAMQRSVIAASRGDLPVAEETARAAMELAFRVGHNRVAARAAAELGRTLALRDRLDEGLHMGRLALAMAVGLDPEGPLEASARAHLGSALRLRNEPLPSEQELRLALAIRERLYGDTHSIVATTLNDLALPLIHRNDVEAAEPLLRRAIAIHEALSGPRHPDCGRARGNLAHALRKQHRLEEAGDQMAAALAILAEALPAEHRDVLTIRNNYTGLLMDLGRFAEAETQLRALLEPIVVAWDSKRPLGVLHHNLGSALQGQGKLQEAERELRTAQEILGSAFGPDDLDLARSHQMLATVLLEAGRADEAEANVRLAVAARERAPAQLGVDLALSYSVLGRALLEQGRLAEAEAANARALELLEEKASPDRPALARVLAGFAALRERQGRRADALALLERAWTSCADDNCRADLRGTIAARLARALVGQGGSETARVRELITIASAALASARPYERRDLDEVLSARPEPAPH
jgi:tetratricopeptide (TPR) repeat protein